MAVGLLLGSGCILWDDAPFLDNVAAHTDADADGFTVAGGDCNDADPDVHPSASDECDGVDNDCDGEVDEVLPSTVWCQDVDRDGFGDISYQTRTCFPQDGWVQDCTDCNDGDRAVNPSETEICNGVDDDCDDEIDPGDAEGATDWWNDSDGDGFGASGPPERSCDAPPNGVQNDADCDDSAVDTFPGATEICGDGRLNDCDGDGKECGWAGQSILTTEGAAFIAGPAQSGEYFGLHVGFEDTNGDGVDEILITSVGEMYGGGTLGALHVWSGAPSGARSVAESSAHLIGVPELYLGWPIAGSPAVRVEEPESGATHLLVAAGGRAEDFDERGVVLAFDDGVYGQTTGDPSAIFAHGRVIDEEFGAMVFPAHGLAEAEGALVVGAPYNQEGGAYSGAVYVVSISAPNAESALASLRGSENTLFGACAVAGQDVDGDGTEDLILGTGDIDSHSLFLYAGPLSGDYEAADADGIVSDRSWMAGSVTAVGDVDSDGLPDLAVQEYKEVQLVKGDFTAADGGAPVVLGALEVGDQAVNGMEFGFAMADFGQDGVADLAVGVPYWDSAAKFGGAVEGGAVAIVPLDHSYLGGFDLWSSATAAFYGPDADAHVGLRIAAGDVNADGYPDLLASATGWDGNGCSDAGGVWFLLGGGI